MVPRRRELRHAGRGLRLHHRRPVRGLLEDPQGAPRLPGGGRKSKEQRALEKQQKAAQKAQQIEGAEASAEEEKPKKRSLFGSGFRLSKAEQAKAEKQEAEAADAAKGQSPKGSKK